MSYSLGVDLGTTFVAAAIWYDNQVEMFTLGDRSVVTPSVVYLREDGVMVTGEAANRRASSSPDRVAREFKRRLGDPTPVILGGTPHAVTDLLGITLRDVLTKVTETEGSPPERVVLTHPANWGPYRRGLFEEVPRLAQLHDTRTTTEPEAAAAHYAASRDLDDGEVVAVYDLGGGTFDVTVLRKRPDGTEILGTPEGIERLGGIDFDEAIFSHVNFAADGALNELDMRDPQTTAALARLRQDCVLAKENLSADTETVLPVFLPGRHFDVKITRTDFENLVRAQIESTIGALSRTLRSAKVTPDELGAVLLVGGSSRIPLVARMVSEELGRPTVVDTHPKYAVALGAATLAGLAAGRGQGHPAGSGWANTPAWPAGAGAAGLAVAGQRDAAGSVAAPAVSAPPTAPAPPAPAPSAPKPPPRPAREQPQPPRYSPPAEYSPPGPPAEYNPPAPPAEYSPPAAAHPQYAQAVPPDRAGTGPTAAPAETRSAMPPPEPAHWATSSATAPMARIPVAPDWDDQRPQNHGQYEHGQHNQGHYDPRYYDQPGPDEKSKGSVAQTVLTALALLVLTLVVAYIAFTVVSGLRS